MYGKLYGVSGKTIKEVNRILTIRWNNKIETKSF